MAKIDIAKLTEGLAFANDEQKKLVEQLFSDEKNQEVLSERYMMRSDYSKAQDETKAAKAAAEAAQRKAADDAAANKAWFDSLKKYEEDVKADSAKAAAYEAYLKDMGLEPATVLAGSATPPPARKDTAPVIDPKIYEEQKTLRDQVTSTAQLLANLPFELQTISNEHFRLFGVMPPAATINAVKEKFLNPQNTKPLTELASEEFHFGDRQKQLEEEALNKRVEQMLAEKTVEWESKHKLPAGALAAAESEPAVNMTSEKFATDIKRSTDADVGNVSERDLAAFQAAELELAQSGIRMTQ